MEISEIINCSKKITVYTVFIVLIGCSIHKSKVNKPISDKWSIYDSLKQLNIPINYQLFNSEERVDFFLQNRIEGSDELVPYAKLMNEKNYRGFVFVNEHGTPILITLNNQQKTIDTLYLLSDAGLIDEAQIKKNNSILIVDSIQTYESMNLKNNQHKEFLAKLEVKKEWYKILKSGRIKKKKSKLELIYECCKEGRDL